MSLFKKQQTEGMEKKKNRWLTYLAAAFFIVLAAAIAAGLIFEQLYQNKIYPGVAVGSLDLGGLTRGQAKALIDKKIDELGLEGMKFDFNGNKVTVLPIVSSFGGDLAYRVIEFNSEETVGDALSIGRNGRWWQNPIDQAKTWINKRKIPLSLSLEKEKIEHLLADGYKNIDQPGHNAELYATTTPNYWKEEIIFKIKEEQLGFRLNYARAIEEMSANLSRLDNSPIEIEAEKFYPSIRKNECQNIETQAQNFLDQAELTLSFEDKKWPVDKKTIAGWLALARGVGDKVVIDLDAEKINGWLEKNISPAVFVKPEDARFEIKDGRVIEFKTSQDGQEIDFIKTVELLRTDFLANGKKSLLIPVKTVKSEVNTENANNFGIKEIIGTGHSNFAGSPKNRIHNIGVGAAALNGVLVAPGEEFSTVKTLGDITAETGYLQEMTIKGDKTVPEYGGGLCQIGTTAFRAAMASGFPITARRPHSYRVAYYEPAGTDATIYGPWPDLRFVNDSKNYILIQTRINGNDIYFDFWGTKDGRTVEQTDPTIYNIVKPPATKYIETLDLKPGVKKCTERAHNGADAYFDYKVTYPDGQVKQERFSSHYVPWQEVCLIGVEKKATSTPATIQ